MQLSQRSKHLKGQPMFGALQKIKEAELNGKKIINLSIGDPDFDTDDNIKLSAIKSIANNETHYAPPTGIWKLKLAYQKHIERRRNFKPDIDQLLVTAGANVQLYYAMACTGNPGDEIIIPDPGFVSYYSIAEYLGLKIVRVKLKEENNFKLKAKDVFNKVTDKTKMIIINSPSNPTGAIMDNQDVFDIQSLLCQPEDIWLIMDDVYDNIIYKPDYVYPQILDKCAERTILVNSFSKSYSMTGWRLGISIAPKKLTQKMGLLLETTSSCVSPFIQSAGIEALKQWFNNTYPRISLYEERMNLVFRKINSINKLSCIKPDGGFYLFVNIKETGLTSKDFCDYVLREAGVLLSPGDWFGEQGEGYVRIAFCQPLNILLEAMQKLEEVFSDDK